MKDQNRNTSSESGLSADSKMQENVPCRGATGDPTQQWAWSCPKHAEQEARRMFQRVLAPWASDLLALRARGLDRPGFLSVGFGQPTPGNRRAA